MDKLPRYKRIKSLPDILYLQNNPEPPWLFPYHRTLQVFYFSRRPVYSSQKKDNQMLYKKKKWPHISFLYLFACSFCPPSPAVSLSVPKMTQTNEDFVPPLPFHYIFVWWRSVHSLPYLYTSGRETSAFGSAFSLWPRRPDRG